MAETAGVPAVGIICSGFMPSARTTAEAAGQCNARLVEFPPPNIGVQSEINVRANARVLMDEVIESLTTEVVAEESPLTAEPRPGEIVFRGNIEEVKARDGKVIIFTSFKDPNLKKKADDLIIIPASNPYLTPVLLTIPLQLFAYHVARVRGCPIDQPRNLAKSVTVE